MICIAVEDSIFEIETIGFIFNNNTQVLDFFNRFNDIKFNIYSNIKYKKILGSNPELFIINEMIEDIYSKHYKI
jgi:hypothetical protein